MHSFEKDLYSKCPIDKLTNLSAPSRSHNQLCVPHAFKELSRVENALQMPGVSVRFCAIASWVKVAARAGTGH